MIMGVVNKSALTLLVDITVHVRKDLFLQLTITNYVQVYYCTTYLTNMLV